jgi:hypothetical protein
MDATLPAPGGSVGLKKLAVYSVGGSLGLMAYHRFVSPALPDQLENWAIGPVNGSLVWQALCAIVGAGVAARFVK